MHDLAITTICNKQLSWSYCIGAQGGTWEGHSMCTALTTLLKIDFSIHQVSLSHISNLKFITFNGDLKCTTHTEYVELPSISWLTYKDNRIQYHVRQQKITTERPSLPLFVYTVMRVMIQRLSVSMIKFIIPKFKVEYCLV